MMKGSGLKIEIAQSYPRHARSSLVCLFTRYHNKHTHSHSHALNRKCAQFLFLIPKVLIFKSVQPSQTEFSIITLFN